MNTPAQWCETWGVPLLDEIPVRGPATARDWKGMTGVKLPGRNHPKLGEWIWTNYDTEEKKCECLGVDPFIGAGGLWLETNHTVTGCDINPDAVRAARMNLAEDSSLTTTASVDDIVRANAETWVPTRTCHFAMFSPPFAQNHSAGATEHQQRIIQEKHLHTMQAFSSPMPNMLRVYSQVRGYCKGFMCVILRNRIWKGEEVDEVGTQVRLMQLVGWTIVGVHPRDLVRPTGYQAWKLAKDPAMPWIRWEWVVVAK
jgi:hypothetical protein